MSDNYFAQNYGVAPPVEEVPIEPPPQAPPPQGTGNYFQDTYVAPPPQQPPSPSAALHADEPVYPTAAPSPPPPPVAATPQPVNPASFEGMNPVEQTLREHAPPALQGFIPNVTDFQNQPTIQDKAGMLASAANIPFEYGARRQGQRAIDAATKGDPNATLGGTDPASLIAHPENVMDVLPTFASNVPGGGPNELNDWAIANPDKVVADDPEATYNAWLADTGRTLETGGISGAAGGLIRGAAVDPTLPLSIGLGTAESAATNVLRTAPELSGVARGALTTVESLAKGGQFVIDPAGETIVRGGVKVAGKVLPGTQPGTGEAERRSGEALGEVLQGTAMANREARNAGVFTPPAVAASPAPSGIPQAPVTPPTNGAVPPVSRNIDDVPVEMLPVVRAAQPYQQPPTIKVRAGWGPGESIVEIPNPRYTPEPNGAPFGIGGNGKIPGDPLPLIVNRNGAIWTLPDGSRPSVYTFDKITKRLTEIEPEKFTAFPGARVTKGTEHQPNKWLAAMTERGYMLDDWPSSRAGGSPQRKAAGQRFIDMESARISKYGESEVKRLTTDFEQARLADAATGAPANRAHPDYWKNRALSLIEAAEKAKYDKPFELSTGTSIEKYAAPTNATPLRGEGFSAPAAVARAFDDMDALRQTVLIQPASRQPESRAMLEAMLQDPEAFTPNHPIYTSFRQKMYQSGAWSKVKASANAPAAKKEAINAAYARYQDIRDLHAGYFPESLNPLTSVAASPERRALEMRLRSRLDSYGLSDVALRVLDEGTRAGHYDFQKIITVGLSEAQKLTQYAGQEGVLLNRVVDHEAIHALRNLGVFTGDEWSDLVRTARQYLETSTNLNSKAKFADVPEAMDQEYVAELYSNWVMGRVKVVGPVQQALQKMRDFFVAIGEAIKGTPTEATFRRIQSGEIGNRARGVMPEYTRTDGAVLRPGQDIPPQKYRSSSMSPLTTGPRAGVYGALDPQERQIADAVAAEFRAHLDAMGLYDVKLGVVDFVQEPGGMQRVNELGMFDPEQRAIDVAVQRTALAVADELRMDRGVNWSAVTSPEQLAVFVKRSLYQTLNHESVHALRASNVITPQEWDALVKEANVRGHGEWAAREYGDLSPDAIDEEAVAEMFGDFALGRALVSPEARSIFQKLVDLFTGLVSTLGRVPNAEGVMQKMLAGEVGARQGVIDTTGPAMARRGSATNILKRATGQSSMLENKVIDTEIPDQEFSGMLPVPWEAMLRGAGDITHNGAPKSTYTVLMDTLDEVDELRFLAETNAKNPLTGTSKTHMDHLIKKYEGYDPRYDWSEMTDAEADRIGADLTTDLWKNERFPKEVKAGGARGLGGDVAQLARDAATLRRVGGLTNWAAMPRQILTQYFGNVVTDSIARPSAIMKTFNPGDWRKAYQGLRGKPVLTSTQEMFERRGLPPAQIGGRSLATNKGGIENPALAKVRDILAPQRNADLVATPDAIHGDALERSSFVPRMRKEEAALPQRVSDTYTAFVKSPKHEMPSVHPQTVTQVTQDLIKQYTLRGEPLSDITGKQLYDGLMAEMKKAPDYGGPKAQGAHWFADRVARDWNGVNNTARQLARKDREYVAFSWDNTRADDILGTAFLYHYWTSRATALYAKEMLKKPWLAGTYYRIGESLLNEADENNYPDWLKGFTRVLASPGGITLLMSPVDMIGTMGIFADWQYNMADIGQAKGDLTIVGQARTMFPLVINPVLDFGAWLFGAYGGEDARIPNNLIGVEPVFSLGAKLLNLANVHGLLPPGMGRDAGGNIVPFAERPITQVAQSIGQMVAGRAPVDLGASFKVNTRFFLEDVLRKEHPEWATDPQGENKLRDAAIEAENAFLRGEESPEWVEAERLNIDMQMTGPDFPGVPEPLRGLFRMGSKLVSPIQMTALPETKTERLYGFNSREGGNQPSPKIGTADSYDFKDIKNRPYDTLDMAITNQEIENWYDIGTDTGMQDAARMFKAIGSGDPGTFTIGATTYTNESLKLLSEHQRYQIAEQYLNSQGLTLQDKDDYYQARNDLMASHPDVAGYMTYKSYVQNEETGGPKGFVDAAVRTSPSFARYMAQTGKVPGTKEYYDLALTPDAYYAIEGRRSSVYDPTVLPDTGTIPGMPKGETFAMKWARDEAVDQAASSSAQGDGSSYDDFVADVDKSVNDLYYAQKLLDETFPGSGLVAGQYIDNSYGAYDTMKAVWEANGVYPPKKGDIAYEYKDWLISNATAPDHSVKAFLNQREQTGPGKSVDMPPVTPEMMAEQAGVALVTSNTMPHLTNTGAIDTTGMIKVTPSQAIEMRSGPSTGNPVIGQDFLYPEDIIYVSDRDGEWAQVVTADNEVGWVPVATLLNAA